MKYSRYLGGYEFSYHQTGLVRVLLFEPINVEPGDMIGFKYNGGGKIEFDNISCDDAEQFPWVSNYKNHN